MISTVSFLWRRLVLYILSGERVVLQVRVSVLVCVCAFVYKCDCVHECTRYKPCRSAGAVFQSLF